MNKKIASVGDIVEYNGYIPEYGCWVKDRAYIEDRLVIGEKYKVQIVHRFDTGIAYRLKCNVWVPIESFGRDINIKEKYGLR